MQGRDEDKKYIISKYMRMNINRVGAKGNLCTATIFSSIVRPHLLYCASNPVPLTKYSIPHKGISS
jgi:hypothetical protein